MTENEVIETLQDIHYVAEYQIKNGDQRGLVYIPPDKLQAFNIAISALKEIQQYRALGTVAELREAMKKQRWIPCSDGDLPEKEVLCCDSCGAMMIGYVFLGEDVLCIAGNDDALMYGCIAWRKLPDPYKEGD